jgi:hypothetical protein
MNDTCNIWLVKLTRMTYLTYVSNETYSRDGPKNNILGQNFQRFNQNDMPLPILVKYPNYIL